MRWAWLYFLGLTLLVVFPWFIQPGFLFLLDFIWPPELTPPTQWWPTPSLSSVPYEWLWWTINLVIPADRLQKLVWATPFFVAGLAMFQLTRWQLRQWHGQRVTVAALAAGTFYALNPFVVTRVFMGHFYLLLAYAVTPWAIWFFLRFLESTSGRRGVAAGLAITAVAITNAHQIFLVPLYLLFLLPRRWGQYRNWRGWLALAAPIVLFVVGSYVISGTENGGLALDPRGPWVRALRAPYTRYLGLDTLLLTANWKTNQAFIFPHEQLVGFGYVMPLLLFAMGWGIWCWRKHPGARVIVWGSVLAAVAAGGLAVGVAHPLTEPIARWMFRHVPFWLSMRDSAKWLAVVALAESILLGAGLATMPRKAAWGVLALTIFLTTPAWRGFSGQVMPNVYPTSWFEARMWLMQQGPGGRVLFLPWHQYLPFSFSDERTISNPAPRFFSGVELISGDNSEVGGGDRPFIYSESVRPLSKQLERMLAAAPTRTDVGQQLATADIRFVMLARDTIDTDRYAWLNQQPSLRLVFERDELFIWKNEAF